MIPSSSSSSSPSPSSGPPLSPSMKQEKDARTVSNDNTVNNSTKPSASRPPLVARSLSRTSSRGSVPRRVPSFGASRSPSSRGARLPPPSAAEDGEMDARLVAWSNAILPPVAPGLDDELAADTLFAAGTALCGLKRGPSFGSPSRGGKRSRLRPLDPPPAPAAGPATAAVRQPYRTPRTAEGGNSGDETEVANYDLLLGRMPSFAVRGMMPSPMPAPAPASPSRADSLAAVATAAAASPAVLSRGLSACLSCADDVAGAAAAPPARLPPPLPQSEVNPRDSANRMFKTARQLLILRNVFLEDNFPSRQRIQEIAVSAGLHATQVSNWFTKERRKERKKRKKREELERQQPPSAAAALFQRLTRPKRVELIAELRRIDPTAFRLAEEERDLEAAAVECASAPSSSACSSTPLSSSPPE